MISNIARIAQVIAQHPRSVLYAILSARIELKRNKLTALADHHGTDKGHKKHLYTRIYHDYFKARTGPVRSILEIGLLNHDVQKRLKQQTFTTVPSLQMWSEYFPDAQIFGFDKSDFSNAAGPFAQIIQGDQSSRDDLSVLSAAIGCMDIIIDDALHASKHQQISFSYLFSKLNRGGIYIIEDLHYQPVEQEEKDTPKTVELLETLSTKGEWESPFATEEEKVFIENNTKRVLFFDSAAHGFNGAKALAIIERCF